MADIEKLTTAEQDELLDWLRDEKRARRRR
jgi:hypothetical protein